MRVTKSDVYYVAELARLKFSEEECADFEQDLNNIFIYFEKLNELDTEGVLPTAHVTEVSNRFREDIVKPSQSRELSLSNAKSVKNGYFKVPKIIE